jgi:hypothetical protein
MSQSSNLNQGKHDFALMKHFATHMPYNLLILFSSSS